MKATLCIYLISLKSKICWEHINLPFHFRGVPKRSGVFDANNMEGVRVWPNCRPWHAGDRLTYHLPLINGIIFLTESKSLIVTQKPYPLLSLQSQYIFSLPHSIHVILWIFAMKLNVTMDMPFSNDHKKIIPLACKT